MELLLTCHPYSCDNNSKRMAKNLKVFIVSGNIGAGKSTTLACLRGIHESNAVPNKVVEFCLENVQSWNHYLELMYLHPSEPKYRWLLQLDVLAHFLEVAKVFDKMSNEAFANPTIEYRLVVERSPNEVIHIFMKSMDEKSDAGNKCLVDCYRNMIERTALWSNANDLYWVWVTCSSSRLVDQIHKRDRPGEKEGLSEDYLQKLDSAYETFFGSICKMENILKIHNNGINVAEFMKTLMDFYLQYL